VTTPVSPATSRQPTSASPVGPTSTSTPSPVVPSVLPCAKPAPAPAVSSVKMVTIWTSRAVVKRVIPAVPAVSARGLQSVLLVQSVLT